MYVNVVTVTFNDFDQGTKELREEVIPMVKQWPGFQRGMWAGDEARKKGFGLVVFDTKENAATAAGKVPPTQVGDPVVREGVTTYEIIEEA